MTTLIDASLIVPGTNDRTQFNNLEELAASIQANGLLQPITVRPIEYTDLYQIIAGERHYRATQVLGWTEVPCLVADKNDEEASIAMLIENVQRNDLDPIDEANAYASRMALYSWSVETLAQKTGLSKVKIQFRLKLLKLRSDIQTLVKSGQLQLGYAQIIADSGLDSNFQAKAMAALRDNPQPAPAWFRKTCGGLLEKQAQAQMFDLPLFGGPDALNIQPVEEGQKFPLPSTTIPPKSGTTPQEIIKGQISFWQQAARSWDKLGENFKRDQCQAAALALKSTLAYL